MRLIAPLQQRVADEEAQLAAAAAQAGERDHLLQLMEPGAVAEAAPEPQPQPTFTPQREYVPPRPPREEKPPRVRKEWTPKRVQNVLLSIGAVLCGIAAVSFVAVAWGRIGLGGRAGLMVLITALAIAASHFAMKKDLKSTAEAVMAIGYTLVGIDLGSAYSLNLFGLNSVDPWVYGAASTLVVTLGAFLHSLKSKIELPGYIAVVTGQVIAPLALVGFDADVTTWSIGLAAQTVATAAVLNRMLSRARKTPHNEVLLGGGVMAGISGAIAALLAAVASPQGFESAAPLAVAAAAAIAIYFIGSHFKHRLVFTGAVAAIALDALIASGRNFEGTRLGLATVIIGAVVIVARHSKIAYLNRLGVGVVGLGLLAISQQLTYCPRGPA